MCHPQVLHSSSIVECTNVSPVSQSFVSQPSLVPGPEMSWSISNIGPKRVQSSQCDEGFVASETKSVPNWQCIHVPTPGARSMPVQKSTSFGFEKNRKLYTESSLIMRGELLRLLSLSLAAYIINIIWLLGVCLRSGSSELQTAWVSQLQSMFQPQHQE